MYEIFWTVSNIFLECMPKALCRLVKTSFYVFRGSIEEKRFVKTLCTLRTLSEKSQDFEPISFSGRVKTPLVVPVVILKESALKLLVLIHLYRVTQFLLLMQVPPAHQIRQINVNNILSCGLTTNSLNGSLVISPTK